MGRLIDLRLSAARADGARRIVSIGNLRLGEGDFVVFAGPCAVESSSQLMETAQVVARAGAHVLRGGAFKPRTSPYSFQGLAKEGLDILSQVKRKVGLPVVTETLYARDVELVAQYADVLQVGARNMQNYELLLEVGRQKKPVILKRGLAATVEEWLLAAEYILLEGNDQVILCERGIRTYESATRNTLDLSAIPVVKKLSSLPIIVDPSHATGRADLILPMALAAAAAGADGIMVEVHHAPEKALCDGNQSLDAAGFEELMAELAPYIQLRKRRRPRRLMKAQPNISPVGPTSAYDTPGFPEFGVTPSREEFVRLADEANIIPVFCELTSDLDTPVSLFQRMIDDAPAFILESVEKGEHLGRYSFLGSEPFLTITGWDERVELVEKLSSGEERKQVISSTDPLAEVQRQLDRFRPATIPGLPPFSGGAVGYIAYDAVEFCEPILRQKPPRSAISNQNSGGELPDLFLMFTDYVLAFDHIHHSVKVIVNARVDAEPNKAYDAARQSLSQLITKLREKRDGSGRYQNKTGETDFWPQINSKGGSEGDKIEEPILPSVSQAEFEESVRQAKRHIQAGDIFQVVLSQRLTRQLRCHPFDLYRTLRTVNPSPYLFYLDCGNLQLVGSSPEILVRVKGDTAELRPIAGTRKRGVDAEEDKQLAAELLADEKERAEHVMLVDLARNDLGRVCSYGTVSVDDFMIIERYSHVMHIVSGVTGKLRPNVSQMDVFRASFPAGTVTGAPKVRAMQLIAELEPINRGPYAGVVGYFDFSGNLDLCIAIRTIVVHEGKAMIQAGAGIVADSDPTREYEETLNKAKGLLVACERAEREWADDPRH